MCSYTHLFDMSVWHGNMGGKKTTSLVASNQWGRGLPRYWWITACLSYLSVLILRRSFLIYLNSPFLNTMSNHCYVYDINTLFNRNICFDNKLKQETIYVILSCAINTNTNIDIDTRHIHLNRRRPRGKHKRSGIFVELLCSQCSPKAMTLLNAFLSVWIPYKVKVSMHGTQELKDQVRKQYIYFYAE